MLTEIERRLRAVLCPACQAHGLDLPFSECVPHPTPYMAFAREVARMVEEQREQDAKIAEAAYGAGAHMPHNRIIAAAIRAEGGEQ